MVVSLVKPEKRKRTGLAKVKTHTHTHTHTHTNVSTNFPDKINFFFSANYAIGIDLGTTNCCVAVYKEGKVETITNNIGLKTTPSTVYFEVLGQTFGEAAIKRGFEDPGNCVSGRTCIFICYYCFKKVLVSYWLFGKD
jgi:hypothetical protein